MLFNATVSSPAQSQAAIIRFGPGKPVTENLTIHHTGTLSKSAVTEPDHPVPIVVNSYDKHGELGAYSPHVENQTQR